MKGLLLDTHALIWMVRDDPRLSRRARTQIENTDRLLYSMASFWEIASKLSRVGFDVAMPETWDEELVNELRSIGAIRLEIQPSHCRQLQDLPWHHKDPFDRMLIAQAQAEELDILTADRRFKEYGAPIVW
jgi:PIN domain nuclease of toxin-antitoxin system